VLTENIRTLQQKKNWTFVTDRNMVNEASLFWTFVCQRKN